MYQRRATLQAMPTEPDLRILQANERTLLAWIRTGLALMAFGYVIARIAEWLRLTQPGGEGAALPSWLGITVVGLGTACHALGAFRFVRARRAIVAGTPIAPGAEGPVMVALVVTAIGVAAIIYLATS